VSPIFTEHLEIPLYISKKAANIPPPKITDAGRMTTQLGTPRGRYDEHSSNFSLSKKPRFVDPVGKKQT
jgi:hypothetical protein